MFDVVFRQTYRTEMARRRAVKTEIVYAERTKRMDGQEQFCR